jgi:hypothetical protein
VTTALGVTTVVTAGVTGTAVGLAAGVAITVGLAAVVAIAGVLLTVGLTAVCVAVTAEVGVIAAVWIPLFSLLETDGVPAGTTGAIAADVSMAAVTG